MSRTCAILGLLSVASAQEGALEWKRGGTKPIKVNIYYEADCPYCKNFVAGEFAPFLTEDCVQSQTDFTWIPFGNAQVSGDTVSCQHGDDECFGNRLHLCAMEKYGNPSDELDKWIGCVMTNLMIPGKNSRDRDTYAPCNDGDADALTQCADNPRSLDALKAAGQETLAAAPQQVPWVVLEESSTYNLQTMTVSSICATMQEKNLGNPQCCIEASQAQMGRRLLV